MQYAGVRNSEVLVGSVTTTLGGYGSYWSLEMGQAVWKWLTTGGNQPAGPCRGKARGVSTLTSFSHVLCPIWASHWPNPVGSLSVDHSGHRVERGLGVANGSYLAQYFKRSRTFRYSHERPV